MWPFKRLFFLLINIKSLRILNLNFGGRFPFLKTKGAGLEFILSEAEGLQSFLKRKGFSLQSLTQTTTIRKLQILYKFNPE